MPFYNTDPTNLKAYMYRGEYYEKMITNNSKIDATQARSWNKKGHVVINYAANAIKEYCRAIHLYPTNYLLYLHRGSLLMKQGKMAEATTDFHAAFDLNASIAQTFIQVMSFYNKASLDSIFSKAI